MTERAAENRAAAQYQLALETVKSKDGRAAVDFLMHSIPDLYPPNFPKTPLFNWEQRPAILGLQRPPTLET